MSTLVDKKEKLGICLTCKHKTDCMYIQANTHLVLHCEEFEVYKYHRVLNNDLSEKVYLIKDETGKYTGLCINCDNHSFCINAANEHVVWQCEQYL